MPLIIYVRNFAREAHSGIWDPRSCFYILPTQHLLISGRSNPMCDDQAGMMAVPSVSSLVEELLSQRQRNVVLQKVIY